MRLSFLLAAVLSPILLVACPKDDETGTPVVVDFDGDGVAQDQDCDDLNPNIFPGAAELCNGLDDDCDGTLDEDDAIDAPTWYPDVDGDGWGADVGTVVQCDAPDGFLYRGGDCDDADTAFHPGAAETDCTDPTDYNCDGVTAWADDDDDGYPPCQDCNDADPAIHADGTEVCNGVDDDCDGLTDEGDAADATMWHYDADEDGYGDSTKSVRACYQQPGTVADATDCDDENYYVNASRSEICNGNDDDCDGEIDDGATNAGHYYPDLDGDRYGDPLVEIVSCDHPDGWVVDHTDCNDTDAAVKPHAEEICNGIDDDCNGFVDDAEGAATWYTDADGDGYGDPSLPVIACEIRDGLSADGTDCNDADPTISPGMEEVDCDAIDSNCDGLGYLSDPTGGDADGDGWAACDDCDDTNPAVHPGADEICDGLDDDCNGVMDAEDAPGATDTYYADADGDGYGDPDVSTVDCAAPAGYVEYAGDCDDTDRSVYPGHGCDVFEVGYFSWAMSYGLVGGEPTTLSVDGEDYPPTFTLWLANTDYIDTFSDSDICLMNYTMSLEPGARDTDAAQDWTIASMTWRDSVGEGCGLLDPAEWGGDPAETVATFASSWEFTVVDADAALYDAILPYLGDEYAAWLYGGHLYLDGDDPLPGEQGWYGFIFSVDSTGTVDMDTMLDASGISTPVDGLYDLEPLYLWSY